MWQKMNSEEEKEEEETEETMKEPGITMSNRNNMDGTWKGRKD